MIGRIIGAEKRAVGLNTVAGVIEGLPDSAGIGVSACVAAESATSNVTENTDFEKMAENADSW